MKKQVLALLSRVYILTVRYKYPIFIFLYCLLYNFPILIHYNYAPSSAFDLFGIYTEEKTLFQYGVFNLHQLPLWNPYVFSGVPFVGNPTAAMFYPINLLYLLFPIYQTFVLIFAIDMLLLGLFTYLFAKAIKLSSFSSFIAAIVFMSSSPIVCRFIPGHEYLIDIIVWFPALMYTVEKFLQTKKSVYIVFAGIVIGMSFLAGGSQNAVYELVAAGIYAGCRKVTDTKIKPAFILIAAFFLLSVLLGVGISAVELFPTREFVNLSIRGKGLSESFASMFALPPFQLIAAFFPHFFGSNATFWAKGNFVEDSLYLGIYPLFLVFFSFFSKKKTYVISFVILFVFALLHSFGTYTPVWYFFYHFVPTFNYFRTPARMLFIFTFSAAILSGIGIDYLFLTWKSGMHKKLFTIIAGISFSLSLLFAGMYAFFIFAKNPIQEFTTIVLRHNRYAVGTDHAVLLSLFLRDIGFFALSCATFAEIVILRVYKKLPNALFFVFIAIFIAADLLFYKSDFIKTAPVSEIIKPSPIFTTIQKDSELYRVFDLSGELFYIHESPYVQSTQGVQSMQLESYRDYLWHVGPHQNLPYESFFLFTGSITNPEILSLLNVKYVISKTPLSQPTFELKMVSQEPHLVNGTSTYYLYKNTSFLPRAYMVNTITRDPRISLLNNAQVMVIKYIPNTISLSVNNPTAGYLVLSENWYPGWEAYDNGTKIPVEKVYRLFRGVHLATGKHTIVFSYNPLSFIIGAGASISSLLFVFVYFGKKIFQKKTVNRSLTNKKTKKEL